MARRQLPIGFQSFRKVRTRGCYYVDKTGYALRLVDEGDYFFLSRPRRFGKSLFLDTLKRLFEGRRELFQGLDAYDRWDWSVRHPVVRISFGGGNFAERRQLHSDVMEQLAAIEKKARRERYGDTLTGHLRGLLEGLIAAIESKVRGGRRGATAAGRLRDLLEGMHDRTGKQVVLLVDEYDKPILDALEDEEVARANRDYLRGLYSTIKDCDDHIRFCFLTGVSKFSKVSLFSGLNNLIDITLEPAYSALCGYTEEDLDTVFGPELVGLDRKQIREWYNGYSWGGEEKVYNPFDVLLLFRKRDFDAWWFETATPTFLIRTLVDRCIPTLSLDGMEVSKQSLGTFDVDEIGTEALLFQTGYLTIVDRERSAGKWLYRLGYPNREVRQSLNEILADILTGDAQHRAKRSKELDRMLKSGDIEGLEQVFHALFAGVPYQWHTSNQVADYEIYYASVCYSYFAGLGAQVIVEESTSRGRLDMSVHGWGRVYLFEFKVVENAARGSALKQLRARRYADKYRDSGKPVLLVAAEFSKKTKNVEKFEAELA